MRGVFQTMAMTVLVVVAWATPASAHGASTSGASNFRTTIRAVTPAQPGISVQVKENGDRLQLRNTSAHVVVVRGYQDEPYLKVTNAGVWQNNRSPAVSVNADRLGGTPAGPYADATATPEWVRVSTGNVAVWHDHRAHWMSQALPLEVEADQSVAHVVVSNWRVPLSVDGSAAAVTGDVRWIPPVAKWHWSGVAVLLGLAVLAIAVAGTPQVALAFGLVLLVAADAVHVLGVFVDGAGTTATRLGNAVTADAASVIAWVVAGWTLVSLRRRRFDVAGYAGLFASVVLFLFGGLTDHATLWDSQVVFGFPSWMARLCVAVTCGAGAAAAASALRLIVLSSAVTRVGEVGERHDDDTTDEDDPR